jgi:hypothetical protein
MESDEPTLVVFRIEISSLSGSLVDLAERPEANFVIERSDSVDPTV